MDASAGGDPVANLSPTSQAAHDQAAEAHRKRLIRRIRLGTVGVALVAAVVLVVLSFTPHRHTPIRLQVIASAVVLNGIGGQSLASGLGLTRLSAVDLQSVDPALIPGWQARANASESERLELLADSAGTIALDDFPFPAGARVLLSVLGPGRVGLRMRCPGGCGAVRVSLSGRIRASGAGAPHTMPLLRGARPVELRLGSTVNAELAFSRMPVRFEDPLQVSALEFVREVPSPENPSELLRRPSILAGSVDLEAVPSAPHEIVRGDSLAVRFAHGEVREIAVTDSAVRVTFSGQVDTVSLASAGGAESLIPSRLQVIWERWHWTLGVMGAVNALIFAAAKWLADLLTSSS
jgi:hypothetical protein